MFLSRQVLYQGIQKANVFDSKPLPIIISHTLKLKQEWNNVHDRQIGGDWKTICEVFSFGVILLGLIAKRTCELEKPDIVLDSLLHVWAKKEYKPQCSLVHNSLQEDWGYHAQDGIAITGLGICCCIEYFFFF